MTSVVKRPGSMVRPGLVVSTKASAPSTSSMWLISKQICGVFPLSIHTISSY